MAIEMPMSEKIKKVHMLAVNQGLIRGTGYGGVFCFDADVQCPKCVVSATQGGVKERCYWPLGTSQTL